MDTGSPIANETISPNTASLVATGTRVDADGIIQPITTSIDDTETPLLLYDRLVKRANGVKRDENVVIGDTVHYTLTLEVAQNVSYVSGTTIQDILPDGLAFQSGSLNSSHPGITLTSEFTDAE